MREDCAGEGDQSGLPPRGPKWAPQSKALKLEGLFRIHLHTSLVTACHWLVDGQVAWCSPDTVGSVGPSSSGPSVSPGTAAMPPPYCLSYPHQLYPLSLSP